ncbi:MAG: aminotransferase class I/II-fold pyridoxal phosphate-dependent enzyme [Rhodovibrio sp.]|nr:aminotransferase class I/II-fold pyridoxal phosphate-dependent enzyme [Rhodovibrio sp.]
MIQLLPRVLKSDRAAVVGPTYGEYAPAWRSAGADVRAVPDPDAALAALDGASRPALVLCNPNNPDGRAWSPDRLIPIADRLARAGGTLVVDEAFADVVPEVSLAGAVERPGLVILRSFGKFFGLAGLRLGFALCAPTLARAMARALGPWSVPGPALEVGRIALADDAWQTAMRAQARRRSRSAAEPVERGGPRPRRRHAALPVGQPRRRGGLARPPRPARCVGARVPAAVGLAAPRPTRRSSGLGAPDRRFGARPGNFRRVITFPLLDAKPAESIKCPGSVCYLPSFSYLSRHSALISPA